MSFHIDIDRKAIRKKYKATWAKTEELQNIELNALSVYDDRYIKIKIRTYESFTGISIDSFLVYFNKYYLQVYLDNCANKIAKKQMRHYLDENTFED